MTAVTKILAGDVLCLAIGQCCSPAQAQEYPVKSVRIIVPLAPGGSSDFAARVVGQELGKRLGQQFVVDNRPGAGSTIGTAIPAKSIRELVRLAKARPGEILFSSSGTGTINHLELAMLASMAGIGMTHVPHKGGDASVLSVISGATHIGADVMPRVGSLLEGGKVRALANTGPRRSPFIPHVPTVNESGLPGYEAELWSGLIAPSGTPEFVIGKLATEIAEIQKTLQFRERFSQNGLEIWSLTPRKFADYIAAEHARWGKMIEVVRPRMD